MPVTRLSSNLRSGWLHKMYKVIFIDTIDLWQKCANRLYVSRILRVIFTRKNASFRIWPLQVANFSEILRWASTIHRPITNSRFLTARSRRSVMFNWVIRIDYGYTHLRKKITFAPVMIELKIGLWIWNCTEAYRICYKYCSSRFIFYGNGAHRNTEN